MEASRRWTRRSLGVLAAILAAVAVVGLLALSGRREARTFLTVSDVLDDPTALYGKSVRVRDRVADVLGATVVTLGAGAGGEEIVGVRAGGDALAGSRA